MATKWSECPDYNARLADAAPELLGGLRLMTDLYVRLVEARNPEDDAAVKYARALLARIEGGA